MPKFAYKIRDNSGKMDSGVLAAENIAEASQKLRQDGKTIVILDEQRVDQSSPKAISPGRKIKRDDIIYFATQLAVMVDTGVPLSEALDSIAEQSDHPGLRAVVQNISDRVKGGTPLSSALEAYPKLFGNLFVAMIRASEVSGTMGQMLQRASEYMENERETRNRIKGAMTYPICMMGFCVAALVGLLGFILPRFEKIYAGKNAVLPLPTKMLLGFSGAIQEHWGLIVGALILFTAGSYVYLRRPSGKIFLDRIRISLPILGGMYRKAYLARSLRTLATMVSSGVSMLEGLSITGQVAGNYFYAEIWNNVAERIKEGAMIADPLFEYPLIPASVSQMVAAGERTGRLSAVLNRVARFCENDLKVAVKAVTSLVEPVMIIVMGLIVGGMAIALLLPVFSISQVIAK